LPKVLRCHHKLIWEAFAIENLGNQFSRSGYLGISVGQRTFCSKLKYEQICRENK
jgi:hypothetical protein